MVERSGISVMTWAPMATAPGIPPPNARLPAFRKISLSGGRCWSDEEEDLEDMVGGSECDADGQVCGECLAR